MKIMNIFIKSFVSYNPLFLNCPNVTPNRNVVCFLSHLLCDALFYVDMLSYIYVNSKCKYKIKSIISRVTMVGIYCFKHSQLQSIVIDLEVAHMLFIN